MWWTIHRCHNDQNFFGVEGHQRDYTALDLFVFCSWELSSAKVQSLPSAGGVITIICITKNVNPTLCLTVDLKSVKDHYSKGLDNGCKRSSVQIPLL